MKLGRSLLAAVWLSNLLMASGRVCSQEPEVNVESMRTMVRATMINSCAAAFIDRGLDEALKKAKESGHTEITEDDLRRTVHSARFGAMMDGVCKCVLAQQLSRVDRATSAAELTAAAVQIDWTAIAKDAFADGGQLCIAAAGAPTPTPSRQRPSAPDWQKVGSWTDGDSYVDGNSVRWLKPNMAQAWVRAVFTAPKLAPNGKPFQSMEVLQNFDCETGTSQSLSYAGFSDREGANAVYEGDLDEAEATFDPSEPGTRPYALRAWVCTHRGDK